MNFSDLYYAVGQMPEDRVNLLVIILFAIVSLILAIRNVSSRKSESIEARPGRGSEPGLVSLLEEFNARLISVRELPPSERAELLREGSELKEQFNRIENQLFSMDGPVVELDTPVSVGEKVAAPQKKTALSAPAAEPPALKSGLEKTRRQLFSSLRGIFSRGGDVGPELFQSLEEALIGSDLGIHTAQTLLSRVKEEASNVSAVDEHAVRRILEQTIFSILDDHAAPEIIPAKRGGKPLVVLVVGVNGVGKTTTIAKLANQFKSQGAKVILGACDTFRAAAVDQLAYWGDEMGVPVVTGPENAKPATVAYQAVHRANAENFDVLILDTAGRLHTRVNLMNELEGVIAIVAREQPDAPHETILVLDASTGQNALQQAREFNQKCKLTGIIVTKLDGTPKGGIVVAIRDELGIPIRYIGIGESVEALKPFSAKDFTVALFAEDTDVGTQGSIPTASTKVRRRKRSEESTEPVIH